MTAFERAVFLVVMLTTVGVWIDTALAGLAMAIRLEEED